MGPLPDGANFDWNTMNFTWIPTDTQSGTYYVDLFVTDGHCDVKRTVTITVNNINNVPPVAQADSYVTAEDMPLTITAPGVLANDHSQDGSLTASRVNRPANGTLTFHPDGSFTYTPALNFNGPDSFTYKANDGVADSNTATASITVIPVNDPPVAISESFTTIEETPIDITLHFFDPDTGEKITYTIVSQPGFGTLSGTAPILIYTPIANYTGPDVFTFIVKKAA
jgi:hypothetical protein